MFVPVAMTYWDVHIGVGVGVGDAIAVGIRLEVDNTPTPKNRLAPSFPERFTIAACRKGLPPPFVLRQTKRVNWFLRISS